MRWHFVVLISLATASAASAQGAEPLVERVQRSIERGVAYLRGQQQPDGGWEVATDLVEQRGGPTALAVVGLLNAGVPKNDAAITRGLAFLRGLDNPNTVYVRSLQTIALAEANFPQDRELIQRNVQFLIQAQVVKGGKLLGWSYRNVKQTTFTDGSNTQYAVLGLWAARQAGADIPREVWESIREHYLLTQEASGAWIYSVEIGPTGHNRPSITMTTAGLCGLVIAGMELNAGREERQPDGSARGCGEYTENKPIQKALGWLGKGFTVTPEQRTFYHLYGLERAGRLSGLRFIGDHDWYREGCDYLTKTQLRDGSWLVAGSWDRWPIVNTSFALLFLAKGRTPVLMSKLVHGEWNPARAGGPRDPADLDWNNDRNDLRHLVPFVGKELYRDLPLAWQTFDLMRAAQAQPGFDTRLTADQETAVVAELLQSPIAYLTGHKSPRLRFTDTEKKLLKRYVESGGFLLAEACCNSPAFERGIKELVDELWTGFELEPLDSSHPVWSSFFPVTPGDPYPLYGLSMGCKTVMIFSPQDLSCAWESNQQEEARAKAAFRLGANIVAYATGREPPRPRLTPVALATARDQRQPARRNYFQAAQVYHKGDWKPAPRAMRNLLDHVNKTAGVDVLFDTKQATITDPSVKEYKFLYMHGRNDFRFAPEQLDGLRFNLENGGLLLADACCGREAFDKAFRQFAQDLFPNRKLEAIPPTDELFSAALNGVKLSAENLRVRTKANGTLHPSPPALEGIQVDGRWAVIYSRYDLGCALERHLASDCVGYDPDSALRLATAAVLYNLKP